MHTSIGGAVESSDEGQLETKEMPRYNKQAQMDGDELSDLLNFDGSAAFGEVKEPQTGR